MVLDVTRYEAAVLRPLRGQHARLADGNLLDRYALWPGMADDRMVERLEEVRAFWAHRSRAPDTIGAVCQLLISADEQLRRTYGAAIDEPAWWREVAQREGGETSVAADDPYALRELPSSVLAPPVDAEDHESWAREVPASGEHGPAWGMPAAPSGGEAGSATRGGDDPARVGRLPPGDRLTDDQPTTTDRLRHRARQAMASQRRAGRRVTVQPARSAAQPTTSSPAPSATASAGRPSGDVALNADALSAADTTVRVRLSWRDPGVGRVLIRYATTQPPWQNDETVSTATLARFGVEVAGEPIASGDLWVVETDVPTGYHVYVPFIIDGASAVVGRSTALPVAPPVKQLKVRRMDRDVLVTWDWPGYVGLAEVERRSATRTTSERVSREAYQNRSGLRLPLDDEPGLVLVRTVEVMADQTEARSKAVSHAVPGRPVNLYWRPTRRAGRSSRYMVDIRADRDCRQVAVTMVASSGIAMPVQVTAENTCQRLTGLDFVAGEPVRVEFDVPKAVHSRRPYWIRCFADRSDLVSIVDPPLEYMKAT